MKNVTIDHKSNLGIKTSNFCLKWILSNFHSYEYKSQWLAVNIKTWNMFNFFKKLEILYEVVLHLFFNNFRKIRLIMSGNATTNDFVYDWSHGGHLAKSVSFFVIGVVIITLNVAEIIIITRNNWQEEK